MNTKIEALLAILEEEAVCYEKMNILLEEEEKSISLSTKVCFDQVQCQKELLVTQLQGLEEKRIQLIGRLAGVLDIPGQPKTVSQLAQCVEPPHKDHLLACAHRLRSLIAHVQQKNSYNQLRIKHYLGLIKGSLKLLSELMDGSPVYRKPGTQQPALGFKTGGGRIIRGSV